MILGFFRVWLVYLVAGLLGAFGWPRRAWLGALGLVLGAFWTVFVADDGPFPPPIIAMSIASFSVFVGLHLYGLHKRHKKKLSRTRLRGSTNQAM